jgi:putative intracellular protease/amidase
VDLATETGTFGFDERWLEEEFLTGEDMAAYNDPAHAFDDFSITDGRVVTSAYPASAHSKAAAFDSL